MNNNNNQLECIEEDEIDLRELWKTILKGKKIIAVVTTVIVTFTFIYVLKMPNVYTSEAVLIPTSKGSSLGGLGGLAAMAGVSVGGGSMTPDTAFSQLLNDYDFMRKFVIKHKIVEHYDNPNVDANYVFAFGFRGIYSLFHSSAKQDVKQDFESQVYSTIKMVQGSLSISSDKKTGLITVAYSDSDRTYPPEIIHAFLKDASAYLVKNNLRIIDNKLKYFSKEMTKAGGIELRQSLSGMISKIVQQKVVMQSKVYYQCDVLTEPAVAYIKDKTKPKRGLILVVSFVTSIILGIFLVFFLEFLRGEKEEN